MATPLTDALVEQLARYQPERISAAAWRVTQQCVLDWCAVTLRGAIEPAARLLREECLPEGQGGGGPCCVVGTGARAGAVTAALLNGTAAHVLDYDDVNIRMLGHPTVVVWSAVLAAAQAERCSGERALLAFIAGYEAAAMLGTLLGPGHYAAGFHATATVGAISAAAACGVLLGLSPQRMRAALGLAAAQAAGLKSMFGTMAKPFQTGRAASTGVLAARLARRGYDANAGIFDDPQGFAAVLGRVDPLPSRWPWCPEPGSEIPNTLFKYHALCLLTHSTLEATRSAAARHGVRPQDVAGVAVHVTPRHLGVCNIQDPRTGLESKFSLRHAAALALAGAPSGNPDFFTDDNARRADLVALRTKVRVVGDVPGPETSVELVTHAGDHFRAAHDVEAPAADLVEQGRRIAEKFHAVVDPLLGRPGADELERAVAGLQSAPDVSALARILGKEVTA